MCRCFQLHLCTAKLTIVDAHIFSPECIHMQHYTCSCARALVRDDGSDRNEDKHHDDDDDDEDDEDDEDEDKHV